MTALLFLPQLPPQAVSIEGLRLPEAKSGLAAVPEPVPILLGCAPGLVDVLASGLDYVAYSVFDCEGQANPTAMEAVAKVSGVSFDIDDEDALLRGPVLIVTRD